MTWSKREDVLHIDRRALLVGGSAATMTVTSRSAGAAEWPSRPVTIVVPWPAGGSNDILARLLARRFSQVFQQPFLIDNRPGANGNVGAALVSHATPNGETLMFTSNGPLTNSLLLYKNLSFDPTRDFAPIAMIGETSLAIVASQKLPATTLKGLTEYARQNPGKLNVGNASIGTIGHLASKLWEFTEGLRVTAVPYRGSSPLQTDIIAGVVDVAFDLTSSYVQLINAGSVRGLAVTAQNRAADLPQIPTATEQGLSYLTVTGWFALVAPAKTPKEILERLRATAISYATSPVGQSEIAQAGILPIAQGPDEFRRAQVDEIAKWKPVVERANIRMD